MVILGLERYEQFNDIVRHHEAGTIPPTVMWGACPTLFDPTQAPDGRPHGVHVGEAALPPDGDAANWDRVRDAHGRGHAATCGPQYAPNLADDTIGWFARSPLDTERTLPNMRGGDLLVGAVRQRAGRLRPPVPRRRHSTGRRSTGLYLCGSSSPPRRQHHRASRLQRSAQVLLADLGLAELGPGHQVDELLVSRRARPRRAPCA